ncbi:hypothetical protein QQX98_004147 [Neonectria punicea]|uniref:Zn(2)-C6 fungal-type domain-containing protein n=1 Tax=Neonectria punicea TaxID=979145 RepID=A0ABR1HBD9_9HYPO
MEAIAAQRSLSFPIAANLSLLSQSQQQPRTLTQFPSWQPSSSLQSLPCSWPGLLPHHPSSSQAQSHVAWGPDARIKAFNSTQARARAQAKAPPAKASSSTAPATRPSGRRPRQQLSAPVAIPATATAPATAPAPAPKPKPSSSSFHPPSSPCDDDDDPVSAASSSANSPSSSSSASASASSRDISPRSRPKPKMPGRPVKRPADSGDEESPGHAANKVKLPRLERPPDDFSSVVKNRLQSYTRTGQACDRCKVRKIRCDALPEGCSHCTNQNLECYVTDRVTGRTERRGYMQELEREKTDMLTHIRHLERLLADNGVEVKPWQWTPYAQYPPGVTFDNMGNPIRDPNSTDTWTQYGTAWVKNDSNSSVSSSAKPSSIHSCFPRNLLESRPGEGHIGVRGDDSAPLSSIKGTQLSILGTTVDLASFDAPDMDEPLPDATVSGPLYNKSTQAFLQSTMNRNPPLQVDLPSREDAFSYSEWYFMTISTFLPLLHKPSFMQLLTRMYDEPDFQPTVAELVIVHMVFAIIFFQYGVRNWQKADQRAHLNDVSNKHYHFALSKFFELTCTPDLPSLQAMAMICIHTRAFPKPGSASIVVNHALHRALELNLHRESRKPGEGTTLNHELRKRAWWVILTIYIAINGRRGLPMPITVEEFDVGFPEPIADELLSVDGVDTSRDIPCTYQVGISSFKIVPILMEMFSNIYSVRRDTKNYVNIVNALEERIRAWDNELPGYLKLGHAEQTEHTHMCALYIRSFLLEFRLLLRHPSVGMTTDRKMNADNTRICEDMAREMLHCQLEIQKLKCLDTTWYQMSLYAASIFSMLVAHWERRFETTPEAIASLRAEMNGWLGILEETGSLLGSGPEISTEIAQIIDRTIAWIEHDMQNKNSKPTLSAPVAEVKQEQSQPLAYQVSEVPPAPAQVGAPNGPSPDVALKGFYQEASLNGQTPYPPIAYGEQAQGSIASSNYEAEAAMFFSTSAQAAVAAAAAVTTVQDVSGAQSNPLIAFASQATQHVADQPAPELIWQGRGNNTWHDWTAALADNQERYSATALLTLGGGPRDSTSIPVVPEGASLATNNMNGVQHGGQWPLTLFDTPNGP